MTYSNRRAVAGIRWRAETHMVFGRFYKMICKTLARFWPAVCVCWCTKCIMDCSHSGAVTA